MTTVLASLASHCVSIHIKGTTYPLMRAETVAALMVPDWFMQTPFCVHLQSQKTPCYHSHMTVSREMFRL